VYLYEIRGFVRHPMKFGSLYSYNFIGRLNFRLEFGLTDFFSEDENFEELSYRSMEFRPK